MSEFSDIILNSISGSITLLIPKRGLSNIYRNVISKTQTLVVEAMSHLSLCDTVSVQPPSNIQMYYQGISVSPINHPLEGSLYF